MSPRTTTERRRDFLGEMERRSRERARRLARRGASAELERRARALPAPPPLVLSPASFDLLAEVKFASPSSGPLAAAPSAASAAERARVYAAAGACAVSVLTEPTRFAGSLAHLRAAARVSSAPVLRKDFLVDPLQLLETRAAGAAGVLLLVRSLPAARLAEMLAGARELGLFVLLEAFDERDLERAAAAVDQRRAGLLVGVNARDLATLEVDAGRCLRLAARLPRGVPCVAESGIASAADARAAAGAGYGLALVGSALMRAVDPAATIAALLAAGRERRSPCASS